MTSPMPDIDLDAPNPDYAHLIGQRVRITLDRGADRSADGLTVVEGVLVKIDLGGEAGVRQSDGVIHWCWPALEVVPLEGQEFPNEPAHGWRPDAIAAAPHLLPPANWEQIDGIRWVKAP